MSAALPIPTRDTVEVRRRPDLVRVVGVLTVAAFAAQVGIELGVAAWLDTMMFGAAAPPPEAIATATGEQAVEVGQVGAQAATRLELLIREASEVQSKAVATIWFLAAGAAVLMMREDARPCVKSDQKRPGVPVPLSPTSA